MSSHFRSITKAGYESMPCIYLTLSVFTVFEAPELTDLVMSSVASLDQIRSRNIKVLSIVCKFYLKSQSDCRWRQQWWGSDGVTSKRKRYATLPTFLEITDRQRDLIVYNEINLCRANWAETLPTCAWKFVRFESHLCLSRMLLQVPDCFSRWFQQIYRSTETI